MGKQSNGYTSLDIIHNFRIYSRFLQMGLDDGWSRRDKLENFELLMKISELSNKPLKNATILDIGCGTGDLCQYIYSQHIKEYVGIDIFLLH